MIVTANKVIRTDDPKARRTSSDIMRRTGAAFQQGRNSIREQEDKEAEPD
jgi:hypothetical protein